MTTCMNGRNFAAVKADRDELKCGCQICRMTNNDHDREEKACRYKILCLEVLISMKIIYNLEVCRITVHFNEGTKMGIFHKEVHIQL